MAAPDVQLDVNGPGVVGHSVVRADLGGGGRTLVVLSGIAIPEWRIDDGDAVHRETCRVLLREPAGTVEQSTVCVGLASISNDGSGWAFATDRASVGTDDKTGELFLDVPLGLAGEPSFLHRFSYQVVLTTRATTTEISGTLRWPSEMFRPHITEPSALTNVFTTTANRITNVSGPAVPGSLGGSSLRLTPLMHGTITAVRAGEITCEADYRIVGAPKGQQLLITCDQHGQLGSVDSVFMEPVADGVNWAFLTVSQPVGVGVDFIARSRTR